MRFASFASGIEAASVAWLPLGWEPIIYSEIDPFACAVLEHRHPNVRNIGNMEHARDGESIIKPGSDSVFIAGTPCQSFSIAGKHGGLSDNRGNLSIIYLRIIARYTPRWFVWENVPGVLSNDRGRTFGTILREVQKLGYGFAYRVLDSQWWGVAQRRRRVFLVGYRGEWWRAASVLFDATGLQWHSKPGRKTWQEIARTLGGRSGEGSQRNDLDLSGAYIVSADGDKAATLTAPDPRAPMRDSKRQDGSRQDKIPIITQKGLKTGTLKASDKQGDTTPVIARSGNKTRAIISNGEEETRSPMVCFQSKASAQARMNIHDKSTTLDASKSDRIAVAWWDGDDKAPTLDASRMAKRQTMPDKDRLEAITEDDGAVVSVRRLTPRECERLQGFPDDYTLVPNYRRTPKQMKIRTDEEVAEMIRYHGLPDTDETRRRGWTPDSVRYKAIGNSMAVPVIQWIGRRIQEVSDRG